VVETDSGAVSTAFCPFHRVYGLCKETGRIYGKAVVSSISRAFGQVEKPVLRTKVKTKSRRSSRGRQNRRPYVDKAVEKVFRSLLPAESFFLQSPKKILPKLATQYACQDLKSLGFQVHKHTSRNTLFSAHSPSGIRWHATGFRDEKLAMHELDISVFSVLAKPSQNQCGDAENRAETRRVPKVFSINLFAYEGQLSTAQGTPFSATIRLALMDRVNYADGKNAMGHPVRMRVAPAWLLLQRSN